MVEPLVEAAVAALFGDIDATVITSWSVANTGDVKGELTKSDGVVVSISVGAPEYDQYTVPSCTLPVAVVLSVRHEVSPTGAALLAVMEPIAAVLNTLQADHEAVSGLSVEGFTADGVQLSGGPGPTFDREFNVWRVVRSFNLRGVIETNN